MDDFKQKFPRPIYSTIHITWMNFHEHNIKRHYHTLWGWHYTCVKLARWKWVCHQVCEGTQEI